MATTMRKSVLKDLGKAYEAFQQIRFTANGIAQGVIRTSKHSIFAMHHGDIRKAQSLLANAETEFSRLMILAKRDVRVRFEGSTRAAVEEFVEAQTYWSVIRDGKIIDVPEAFDEEYIAGLADLTGELVRRAVTLATEGKREEFDSLYASVREIVGALHTFPLTGYVRQKADDAKRNLHKIEDIRLQLSHRR